MKSVSIKLLWASKDRKIWWNCSNPQRISCESNFWGGFLTTWSSNGKKEEYIRPLPGSPQQGWFGPTPSRNCRVVRVDFLWHLFLCTELSCRAFLDSSSSRLEQTFSFNSSSIPKEGSQSPRGPLGLSFQALLKLQAVALLSFLAQA